VHTDGFNWVKLPQPFKVMPEIFPGFINISVAGVHIFIMVTNLVAKVGNLFDNSLVPAIRNNPEIVGAGDSNRGLQSGKLQRVVRGTANIMSEEYRFTICRITVFLDLVKSVVIILQRE